MMLSDVCLTVAYIGPKSRTVGERGKVLAVGNYCYVTTITRNCDTGEMKKALRGDANTARWLL